MNQLVKKLVTEQEPWISIHDKRITKIDCYDDKVVFFFSEGFDLIENNQLCKLENGVIQFSNCQSSDFFCRLIYEKNSFFKIPKFYGKEISLELLSKILDKKNKEIEVYIELYSDVFTYWRGVFVSHHTKINRSPIIVIETMDFFPMTYLWE